MPREMTLTSGGVEGLDLSLSKRGQSDRRLTAEDLIEGSHQRFADGIGHDVVGAEGEDQDIGLLDGVFDGQREDLGVAGLQDRRREHHVVGHVLVEGVLRLTELGFEGRVEQAQELGGTPHVPGQVDGGLLREAVPVADQLREGVLHELAVGHGQALRERGLRHPFVEAEAGGDGVTQYDQGLSVVASGSFGGRRGGDHRDHHAEHQERGKEFLCEFHSLFSSVMIDSFPLYIGYPRAQTYQYYIK